MGDSPDWQFLFNIAIGIIGTIVGWFVNILWNSREEMKRDHAKLKEDIRAVEKETANIYLRKDDFYATMNPIREQLNRIENKLDNKVDKP